VAKKIGVGIDIGTYHTKVMVVEASASDKPPRIIGTGFAETRGVRHGYIMNRPETTEGIKIAIAQAEKAAGISIRKAYVSVGGIGLGSVTTTGAATASRADSEITELDTEKAIEAATNAITPAAAINKKIIHRIPIQWRLDGKNVVGPTAVGLKGNKLEVKTLFITCLEQHLNDLIEAVEDAGVEALPPVASPLAASLVVLNKTQKIAGVLLANIGAETVSIVIFENNIPISLEVFPYGSTNITNDIALGLKVPIEEAEEIKRGNVLGGDYSRRDLDKIIIARLHDIFDLVEAHLKKIGRSGLLPAGIIITGGGSRLNSVEDLARQSLGLPSRIAKISFGGNIRDLHDSVWSVCYGLCLLHLGVKEQPFGVEIFMKSKKKTLDWLKQLLP
jgi:cell division protein FtsA